LHVSVPQFPHDVVLLGVHIIAWHAEPFQYILVEEQHCAALLLAGYGADDGHAHLLPFQTKGAKQVTQPVALLQLSVDNGQQVVLAPLPLTK